MLQKDALQARGKALEDEYFHRVDEAICLRMRESLRRDEAKKMLNEALGFENDALVEHMLDAGVEAGTVSALVLVPLVFVAWSDGEVSAEERQQVMSEALHRGMRSTQESFLLVEHWLDQRPPQKLWTTWCEYTEALRKSLPNELERVLSGSILNRCEAVAQATAGLWGTNRVSKPERAMLEQIRTFLNRV